MESRTKVAGHPLHPMLIVFPVGLFTTGISFDIVAIVSGNAAWFSISFWMIAAGLLGGLLAALPGTIDWLAMPRNTRAKSIGLWHGGGNAIVMILFAISWFVRRANDGIPSNGALVLSFIGIVIALCTAWLGGELVDRLGVGVDSGAHLDAPSSLSGRPASESEPERLRRAG